MLAGMARKEKRRSKRRLKRDWAVYVLRCADETLYTGVTNDLKRRFKMHNKGTGARYTRDRRPVELLYHENRMTRSQALIRECVIKALPKAKKEDLVRSHFKTFILDGFRAMLPAQTVAILHQYCKKFSDKDGAVLASLNHSRKVRAFSAPFLKKNIGRSLRNSHGAWPVSRP